MADARQPMTPAEFDAACRALLDRIPWLSETSGYRTPARNERVGGSDASKHLLGMARDFAGSQEGIRQAAPVAVTLALWVEIESDHLHVQGLPPGEVPEWWRAKYMR